MRERYKALAGQVTPVLSHRAVKSFESSPWMPVVEIAIEIGGALINFALEDAPNIIVDGTLDYLASGTSKKGVIRFIVRNTAKAKFTLENDFQLREGRLDDAKMQWQELIAKLDEDPKFNLVKRDIQSTELDKTEK